MTNITWSIRDVNTYHEDSLENIVHSIKWECTVSNETDSESMQGSAILPKPSEDSFLPVDSLTEELVMQWLETSLGEGKAEIEANLTSRLQAPKLPPTTKPTWLVG